jgi:hypothetical protein
MSIQDKLTPQLQKIPAHRGLEFVGSDKAKIRCPLPDHKGGQERTPSLFIFLETGGWYCQGCKEQGRWNELAPRLGLKPLKALEDEPKPIIMNEEALLGETEEADPRESPWPKDLDWRRIPARLLGKVGGLLYIDNKGESCLRLPVYVYEERVGHIDCLLEKPKPRYTAKGRKLKAPPSYENRPGIWAKQTLFPYDYTVNLIERKGLRCIVLVEGPRDALRLLSFGIPALSCLGAQWDRGKRELLAELPIDTVILAFDNDNAGELNHERVTEDIGDSYKLLHLKFAKGSDPAKLSDKACRKLKRRIYSRFTSSSSPSRRSAVRTAA